MSSSLRPGLPELHPMSPLPRVGPPSGEFASRSSASNPSTVPPTHRPHRRRPPHDLTDARLQPSPFPPSVHPSAAWPSPTTNNPVAPYTEAAWNPFVLVLPRALVPSLDDSDSYDNDVRKSRPLHSA